MADAKVSRMDVEHVRADVVRAFASLPPDAFEQCLTWLCPDRSRPIRFGALDGAGYRQLQAAVAAYFKAQPAA